MAGSQMDRQTNTHTHTHTTKHLMLERSIKPPNASEREVGENTGQEALRGVGRGPPRGWFRVSFLPSPLFISPGEVLFLS